MLIHDGTGGTVLGTANYGTNITVGNGINGPITTFLSDGSTTYSLVTRDVSDFSCNDITAAGQEIVGPSSCTELDCGDLLLEACTSIDQNDGDECSRIVTNYYLSSSNQNLTNLEVKNLFFSLSLEGKGYFDNASDIIDDDIFPSTIQFFNQPTADRKTMNIIWTLYSQCDASSTSFSIPINNDCQSPLFSIVTIVEPGETIETIGELELVIFDDGNVTNYCDQTCSRFSTSQATKANATDCPEGLIMEITGLPTDPVDPHEEQLLYVTLRNEGNEAIDISELDFRIKIEDINGNLDIALDPEELVNPVHAAHEGDEHYYLLNELPDNILIPFESENIFSFSISPPGDLENLAGMAMVQVLFGRVNGGVGSGNNVTNTCCQFDVSEAKGKVIFPGQNECTDNELRIYASRISNASEVALTDCEVGFGLYVENISGDPVQITELTLEVEVETSGDLMLSQMHAEYSNDACFDVIDCAITNTGCAECDVTTKRITFNLESTDDPILMNQEEVVNLFTVVLGGLNGSLDNIAFKKVAVATTTQSPACIPVDGYGIAQNFILPQTSNCDFCDDVQLVLEPSTSISTTCEKGFVIEIADNTDGNLGIEEVVIEFMLFQSGAVNIVSETAFCNGNTCGATTNSGCLTQVGNLYTYEYCPASPNINLTGFELIEIIFNGTGTIEDIVFTQNTRVKITDGAMPIPTEFECTLQEATNTMLFPINGECTQGTLSGTIVTETGENVDINLVTNPNFIAGIAAVNSSTCPSDLDANYVCYEETETSSCGLYNIGFNCSVEEAQIAIVPRKNVGYLNGVTTFDLVTISKHILNINLLDSPYKMIAADANNSGSISTLDLVIIRKLILVIEDDFGSNNNGVSNPSWQFIDSSYDFPNPSNPWAETYPECVFLNTLEGSNANDLDFIGVKIGDVNNSVNACDEENELLHSDDRQDNSGIVFYHPETVQTGKEFTVNVALQQPDALVAWQAGVQFDPTQLDLLDVIPLEIDMTSDNFGLTDVNEGKIRSLWFDSFGDALDYSEGRSIFQLKFKALNNINDWASILSVDQSVLNSMTFDEKGTPYFIGYANKASSNVDGFINNETRIKVKAFPNPFASDLNLAVRVTDETTLDIQLFDIYGKQVFREKRKVIKGLSNLIIENISDLPDGLYNWRVSSSSQSQSGKIVKQ